MPLTPNTTCRLDNLGFLAVTGHDAGDFLQRQTTQDITALPPGGSALAGWLDARGRVRAVFRVLRARERWLLAITDQVPAALGSELKVYVLRSKVKLAAAADWVAVARLGPADDWRAARASDETTADASFVVEIAPGLTHLYGAAPHVTKIAADAGGDPQAAIAAEIAAGLPSVPPGIAQAFTAQMLNLDRLGGIAFAKGCYPGQEVTARTANLGTVKRRALPFRCSAGAPIAPGTEVLDAAGAAVGRTVRAASVDAQTLVLAVVELERSATPLYLAVDGRPRLTPLPNPLP